MNRICAVAIAVIVGAASWGGAPGATAQTAADIKGVEEGQKVAEGQVKAKLPWKIDEVTTRRRTCFAMAASTMFRVPSTLSRVCSALCLRHMLVLPAT